MTNSALESLLLAIKCENIEEVKAIVGSGIDIEMRDVRPLVGNGNTALHDAAGLGNIIIVQLLLDAGADVNAQCFSGWTPLMRACDANQLEVVTSLLGVGANVNVENKEGYTAKSITRSGHKEILDQLEKSNK